MRWQGSRTSASQQGGAAEGQSSIPLAGTTPHPPSTACADHPSLLRCWAGLSGELPPAAAACQPLTAACNRQWPRRFCEVPSISHTTALPPAARRTREYQYLRTSVENNSEILAGPPTPSQLPAEYQVQNTAQYLPVPIPVPCLLGLDVTLPGKRPLWPDPTAHLPSSRSCHRQITPA